MVENNPMEHPISITPEVEVDYLARLIYSEGGKLTRKGKEMIGSTVRNRVKSPSFPDAYSIVIYQGRHRDDGRWIPQYSAVGGDRWRNYDHPEKLDNKEYRAWTDSREVARDIYGGAIPDKAEGVEYFHSMPPGTEKGFFKDAVEDGRLIEVFKNPVEGMTFLKTAPKKRRQRDEKDYYAVPSIFPLCYIRPLWSGHGR